MNLKTNRIISRKDLHQFWVSKRSKSIVRNSRIYLSPFDFSIKELKKSRNRIPIFSKYFDSKTISTLESNKNKEFLMKSTFRNESKFQNNNLEKMTFNFTKTIQGLITNNQKNRVEDSKTEKSTLNNEEIKSLIDSREEVVII